jgi:hypothetical protein
MGVGGLRHARPLEPLERDPVPTVREAGWTTETVWTGFEPRTVQPVASCYDYVMMEHWLNDTDRG